MSPRPVFGGDRDVLLIGGPADGTMVTIHSGMRSILWPIPNSTQRHKYDVELLVGRDGTRHYVGVSSSLHTDPLFEIIEHYKQTKGIIRS